MPEQNKDKNQKTGTNKPQDDKQKSSQQQQAGGKPDAARKPSQKR